MATKVGSASNSFHDVAGFRPLYTWGMVVNATFGMFAFGYILGVLNTISEYLNKHVYLWGESATDNLSLLNSLMTVGAGIGAFAAGPITKAIGRRTAMMAIDVLFILGLVATFVTVNFPLFLIGRIICGFCAGCNSTVVPLYVNEVAPLSIRGTSGAVNQIQVCAGALVSVLLGLAVPDANEPTPDGFSAEWWRFMLGFPIIFVALRLVGLLLIYKDDTAKFLVTNDKVDEAKSALDKIYIGDYATEQLMFLKRDREEEQRAGKITYKELVGPRLRKRLMIGCFVALLQQLTAVNAFIFYSNQIFDPNADNPKRATLYTIILNVFNLCGTLVSSQVIKNFGRKTILIWGLVGIALTIFITSGLMIHDSKSELTIYPLFTFIVLFGLTYGPIVWIFVAEILPDIGISCAILLNWVGSFIIAQTFAGFFKQAGGYAFLTFGIIDALALFVIVLFIKETRGCTPAEIAALYGGKDDAILEDNIYNNNLSLEENLVHRA